MAKLIYMAVTSLDGYVADERGDFAWAAPDEETHACVNDLMRPIGLHLYGRRMYDTLVVWEHPDALADQSPVSQDFARIWQAADKIVYSRTLETASSARTRIESDFDAEAVRRMKATMDADLSVGGPHLAAEAIKAGLVDELHLFMTPITVGGGNPALPGHFRWPLDLLDARRFASGVVHLHYRARMSDMWGAATIGALRHRDGAGSGSAADTKRPDNHTAGRRATGACARTME